MISSRRAPFDLAPTLQRGSKSRRSSVAWGHWPLERPDGIPTLERGNEKNDYDNDTKEPWR